MASFVSCFQTCASVRNIVHVHAQIRLEQNTRVSTSNARMRTASCKGFLEDREEASSKGARICGYVARHRRWALFWS